MVHSSLAAVAGYSVPGIALPTITRECLSGSFYAALRGTLYVSLDWCNMLVYLFILCVYCMVLIKCGTSLIPERLAYMHLDVIAFNQ